MAFKRLKSDGQTTELMGPERAPERRAIAGEETWWTSQRSAGMVVTKDTALQLPAVLALANTIATDVAVFPLRVHQEMPDGSSRLALERPERELFERSPNGGESTPVRWRQSWMLHALTHKGGFAEIQRRNDHRPYAFHLLDPETTRTKRVNGTLTYTLANGRSLPASDVLHIAGLGYDGVNGYDFLKLLSQTLGLGMAEEAYAADFFENGSESGGTIEIPTRLQDQDAVDRLRNQWEGRHQGAGKRHKVAVLEEGAKYSSTSVDPEKSQLLESRKFQLQEMIRAWRLPPHKAGDMSDAHYANLEASNADYLATALLSWLTVIEQEFDLKVFSRAEWLAGYRVKHDTSVLMKADTNTRYGSYNSALQGGWMSRNEVRRRENLNPMRPEDGGDAYTVQMQVVALGPDGARQPATPAAASPAGERREAPDLVGADLVGPEAVGPEAVGETRYNHNHDAHGRFTFSKGGGGKTQGRLGFSGPGAHSGGGGGGSIGDRLDALASNRRDPSTHTEHPVGHVGEIKTDLIHFDPHRFQYKLGGQGAHGVTDALAGVKKYDPNLGGILQVWKDHDDGKTYVVNGHHRLDLAKKLDAPKVAVRFIGAKDAEEARGIGALTNIAEGRGTSVDAANFFRDTGHSRDHLEAKGIPMKERVATEGIALAGLSKPIFNRVISGDLSPSRGAIIGTGTTHAQQEGIIKVLDTKFSKSKQPSDATLRQTVRHAINSPTVKVKSRDLFGDNEDDVSLAFHRGETSAHILERLSREKRVFGTVAKERNAADLERGNNRIDTHESGKISAEAARNLDTFNILQDRSGPVSALLNEAAERKHKGESKKKVHDDVYRRLHDAVNQALNGF